MQIPALSLHLIADGTDSDVSTLVREYRPTDRGMSEDFGHAVSTRAITLRYDQSIASIITSANEILVIATLDGQMDFTGRIVPGASLTSRGASLSQEPDVDDITIEADDFSYRFDRQITQDDNIALENYKVCNPQDPTKSIVHFLCSLVDVNVAISENIDVTIRGFSADHETVGTLLSTLLSEYGYSWRLDVFGRVVLLRWMYDSPQPQVTINEHVMLGQLTAERLVIEADAVEVSWTALKERSRTLLYMADLPYGDDNRRSGWPIQPGYLYPEESNIDETWWNYDDVSLTNRVDERGRVKKEANYSGIVLTRNHYIEEKKEQGISRETTMFQNKRARITYRCSTTESKKLYYSNILADVVYRGAKSVERANIVADPKTVDRYDASYIHDSNSASKLCQARARRLKNAAWRYIFCSEISWPVGTIISIQDPYSGISAIAIIIERQPDLITNIIEYKAVGLSDAAISVSNMSTSILPGPDKRSSVGIEGIADAIALASISLLLSSQNISRNRSGNLFPPSITITARRQDTLPYHCRIRISLSHDGQAYQDVYSSSIDEASKAYTVPATMTVGAETHYVTSGKVEHFAAGGFDTLLGTDLFTVSVDASVKPIYFRTRTEPPVNPLANDSYFDGRTAAQGGGVIRYWTGSAWVVATASWPMYGEIWGQASVEAFNWQVEQGVALEETVKLATATARAMAQKQIVEVLPPHPYTGYQVGDTVVLTGDKKIYRLTDAAVAGTGGWSRTVDGGDIVANSIVSGSINCGELASSSAFVGALEASTAFIGMLSVNTLLAQHIGASTAFINSFKAQDVILGGASAYLSILPNAPGTHASPKIQLVAGDDYIKLTNAGIEFKTTIFDVQSQMSSFTSGLTVAGLLVSAQSDAPAFNLNGYKNWDTGSFDATGGGAAIVNDNGDYKALMILGNRSAGGVRIVKLWDRLEVNGACTATFFDAVSARAFKKDIMPFNEEALPILLSIDIVSFKYRNDTAGEMQVGFIADDTSKLVSGVKHSKMKMGTCIGLLIKAVQEQAAEIRQLKEEVYGSHNE